MIDTTKALGFKKPQGLRLLYSVERSSRFTCQKRSTIRTLVGAAQAGNPELCFDLINMIRNHPDAVGWTSSRNWWPCDPKVPLSYPE
jgi:hypothetical protein